MQHRIFKTRRKAFSLLEMLLYISIMSVVIVVASALFSMLIEGRQRNQALVEVQQQGNFILDTFSTTLKNSRNILNITSNSLTFETYDEQLNPVIISESEGIISISYAGGTSSALNTDSVLVNDFTIIDVSNSHTTGSVKLEFSISYNTSSQRNVLSVTESFTTTASIRRPGSEIGGAAGSFLDDWSYTKEITINNAMVVGLEPHLDFPFLVYLEDDVNLVNYALANGDDIIFTSNTGVLLDFEIEKYDNTTGELVAWIKIPTLSTDSDTTINMYYGNASALNMENPDGIWGSDYALVQHMNQDPTGAAPQIVDSTIISLCDKENINDFGLLGYSILPTIKKLITEFTEKIKKDEKNTAPNK